jgi:CO/xanthine dehydrogenase FAD-binding subunit
LCIIESKLKSPPFQYTRAGSLGEACEHLARYGEEAKVLAGGQSLVPMMAMRLLRPAWLVDVNELAALKYVLIEQDKARIGACTTQASVLRDAALAQKVPLLRQALAWVGHGQTRNRGTIGGSLAHADPSAELPLVAVTLQATMHARSSAASRSVNAQEFFTGAMSTALRPEECLEQTHWPIWPERRTGSGFAELSIRHGDFAIVAAAAQVALDEEGRCTRAAFGLGGVGSAPLRFAQIGSRLRGSRLDDALVEDVAAAAAAQCEPGNDLHASAGYRRHLARVLGARALREARDTAVSS